MDTKLTIKNFRVFDEDGVSIDLKPITILTGCNSSGKSSITKAILLLNSFLKQIKKAIENDEPIEIFKYKLDFTQSPYNLLGRFDKIVHKGATSKQITFEYETYSYMLSKNVKVSFVFCTDSRDKLNNGYLDSLSLSIDEGIFFYSNSNEGSNYNFNFLKESACDFMALEFLIHNFYNLQSAYDENEISQKEYEEQKQRHQSAINQWSVNRRNDVYWHVRTCEKYKSIIDSCHVTPDVLEWTMNNDYSLFNIPIIKKLNNIKKSEFKDFVEDKILQKSSVGVKRYSYKIIDDFITSDFIQFGDFFKKYEIEFLSKVHLIRPISDKTENIFSNQKFRIYDNDPAEIKVTDFEKLYEVLMCWNRTINELSNVFYQNRNDNFDYIGKKTDHYMFDDLMTTFASDLVQEILNSSFGGDAVEYVSSSRINVHRLYTLDKDDDFTILLKRYFECEKSFTQEKGELVSIESSRYVPESFMNKWIKKFELGEGIYFNVIDAEGLGVKILLRETSNDDNEHLLADEGYGITQLFSLLLQIETSIRTSKVRKLREPVENFIDGDSLVNYLMNELTQYEERTIIVEEPEIHLHPKFQSMLADMMVDAYKNYNIHFIVETHSEYLIRKLQVLVAGKANETDVKIKNNEISLLYVDASKEKGIDEPQVKRIEICEDGYLDDTFGEGFFDEATKWSKKLIF